MDVCSLRQSEFQSSELLSTICYLLTDTHIQTCSLSYTHKALKTDRCTAASPQSSHHDWVYMLHIPIETYKSLHINSVKALSTFYYCNVSFKSHCNSSLNKNHLKFTSGQPSHSANQLCSFPLALFLCPWLFPVYKHCTHCKCPLQCIQKVFFICCCHNYGKHQ